MNATRSLLAAALLLAAAAPGSAQSLFATRGLGVPAPAVDARSAALGGIGIGLIGFHTSLVNPAEIAGITRRGVSAALQPVSSTTSADGAEDGTSGTRFPLMRIIYPFTERVVGSFGFGSYLEQSWALVSESQQVIGGTTVDITDVLRSTGGVAQLQLGAAYSVSPTLAIGAAAGLLTGNVERVASRAYSDTTILLRPFQERLRWEYFAPIVSLGFRLDIAGAVRVSGSVMTGADLDANGSEGAAEDRTYGAPLELSAGASARLSSLFIANGGGVWSRMPEAGGDAVSRETWRIGGGLEYEGVRSGARAYPIRLGARYAQLPYHFADEKAPTEVSVGLGAGFRLGDPTDPSAVADFAFERASRNGLEGGAVSGGLEERLWRVTFSISLFGR